jgi:RNA polymerase sigma factor (sigma-70 family)
MPVRKPNLRGVAERNAIAEANQGLVRQVARSFRKSWIDRDDLIAAGQLGLLRAAELWDPENCQFSTFAYPHILQSIRVTIWQYSGAITVPRSAHEAHRGHYKGMRPSSVEAASRAITAERSSLHEAVHGLALLRTDPGFAAVDDRDEVESWLSELPEREAHLLRLRFGLIDGIERTRRDVGRELRVSGERTRQLEERGMERLRELASA